MVVALAEEAERFRGPPQEGSENQAGGLSPDLRRVVSDHLRLFLLGGRHPQQTFGIRTIREPSERHPGRRGREARATLAGANDCGAIYGVKDADVSEAFPPGIWQSYDIVFRAARWDGSTRVAPAQITVVWNGSVVQRDVAVPGSTTLGDPEGPAPAPLRLQCHGHAVRFPEHLAQPL